MDFSQYRELTSEEIAILQGLGNISSNWNHVQITCSSLPEDLQRIRNNQFHPGDRWIRIGRCTGFVIVDGITMPCGIQNSNFYETIIIGDDVLILNTLLIADVVCHTGVIIFGCGKVTGSFAASSVDPTKLSLSLGAESFGRKLSLSMTDSFQNICRKFLLTSGQHLSARDCDNELEYVCRWTGCLPDQFVQFKEQKLTVLCSQAELVTCDEIKYCFVGPRALISSSSLINCVLLSSLSLGVVTVRKKAHLVDCILQPNCTVADSCHLHSVFLCESSSVGEMARIHHSVIGPDSSVAGGECHHSVVGPFTGFHHQSLLIASFWPSGRGNIAYGAKVGANHTGRVNDQECWVGEGIFFGLDSCLKFPVNLVDSPYSMVAAGAVVSPQCIRFPFSLVLPYPGTGVEMSDAPADGCIIKPGWVLIGNPYLLERATLKFSSRKTAKFHNSSYSVIRPRLIDQVADARDRLVAVLSGYEHSSPELFVSYREVSGLGRCIANIADIRSAIVGYSNLISRYALHGLYWLLADDSISSSEKAELLARDLDSHDFQGNTSTPGEVSSSDRYVLMQMVEHLAEDVTVLSMHNSAKDCSSLVNSSYRAGYLITDWFIPKVRNHQLQVLRRYFPSINFSREHLDNQFELCTTVGGEGAPIVAVPKVCLPYLDQLSQLEDEFARNVESCRKRDGIRGESIIPGYRNINAVAHNTEIDGTVARAKARALFYRKAVKPVS